MDKVAVIGVANLYSMPYSRKYTSALENSNMEYDLIFWDREAVGEEAYNYHAFRKKINSSKNVFLKLFSFFQFRKYAIKILDENQYDKIILLYSLPAVLLRKYLKKHYKKNYIFVYTDYSFEKNPIYKAWIKSAVENSYFTTVTSVGFIKYLPQSENILPSHNIMDLEDSDAISEKSLDESKIVISYIGMLRQFHHIIKFVKLMANDNRFIINYYGNGFCEDELRKFIKAKKIKNVFFYGKYEPEDKMRFINECDIINNCFANDKFQKYAMTNRFYDAILNLKPQIVNVGSHSQKIVEEYVLGIAVNLDEKSLGDKLYKWYKSINMDELYTSCTEYMRTIQNDEEFLEARLQEYLRTKKYI